MHLNGWYPWMLDNHCDNLQSLIVYLPLWLYGKIYLTICSLLLFVFNICTTDSFSCPTKLCIANKTSNWNLTYSGVCIMKKVRERHLFWRERYSKQKRLSQLYHRMQYLHIAHAPIHTNIKSFIVGVNEIFQRDWKSYSLVRLTVFLSPILVVKSFQ